MLQDYGYDKLPVRKTPVDTTLKAIDDDDEFLNIAEHKGYRSAVGALLYAGTMTRPDISFALGSLSRNLQAPTHKDLRALERVFAYLNKTKKLGITYSRTSSAPEGVLIDNTVPYFFVDSSYGDVQLECKGTTGWIAIWKGGPIAWKSKKQSIQSQSTAEAEIIAAADAAKEAMFLRMLFQDIGLIPREPTVLLEDNTAAIMFSNGEGAPQRLRHMDIRRFALREAVYERVVRLVKVDGKANVADMLTKGLPAGPLGALRARVLRVLTSD
jgi:hypothetical protein